MQYLYGPFGMILKLDWFEITWKHQACFYEAFKISGHSSSLNWLVVHNMNYIWHQPPISPSKGLLYSLQRCGQFCSQVVMEAPKIWPAMEWKRPFHTGWSWLHSTLSSFRRKNMWEKNGWCRQRLESENVWWTAWGKSGKDHVFQLGFD